MYQHRLAREADLPAIVAIYNSTIASRMVTADTEEIGIEQRQAWFEQHQTEQNQAAPHPLWVVEKGGEIDREIDREILGWLSFSSFHSRAAYAGSAELSIYLAPSARGKGLGRYLLEAAIQAAPGLGFHSLIGLIFGHNLPSLGLFERYGFARWGHLPGVAILDGCARDLVIVGKKI